MRKLMLKKKKKKDMQCEVKVPMWYETKNVDRQIRKINFVQRPGKKLEIWAESKIVSSALYWVKQ